MFKTTVVIENTVAMAFKPEVKRGLLGEHGMSLLIEGRGKRWLFDTGCGSVLLHNLDILGVAADSIDALIISHGHYDHAGAMMPLLEKRSKPLPIYAHPDIFARHFAKHGEMRHIGIAWSQDELEASGAEFSLRRESAFLSPDTWLSGAIPRRYAFEAVSGKFFIETENGFEESQIQDDQSLVLAGERGLLVITGCAHAGICNIIAKTKEQFPGKRIWGIMGGLHLSGAGQSRVEQTAAMLKEENLEFLAVGHCTGAKESWQLANYLDLELTGLNTGEVLKIKYKKHQEP